MSELESLRGYDYTRVPPEIWHLVVRQLSDADQRSYLAVSRLFRDLARPLLSIHITIHLGRWSVSEDDMFDYPALFQLFEQKKADSNAEKLQCIARDAQFARSVKVLTVKARVRRHRELFKIGPIAGALKALTRLQSFRWYGDKPSISAPFLKALASTRGSTLTELRVYVGRAGADTALFLPQSTNLQTLSLAGRYPQHLDDMIPVGTPASNISPFAQRTPSTLRNLSIWGDAVWDTPVHVLSGLHELSLKDPQNLEKLDTVFKHCPQLRSLELLTSSPSAEAGLLAAFEAAPAALPHLTSFKVVLSGCEPFLARLDLLAAFLRQKQHLRRLDLQLNEPLDGPNDLGRYLDLFAAHPQLEVAGLMLPGRVFQPHTMQMLDARLPLGLSALLIAFSYRSSHIAIPIDDWMSMLQKRASLGYLHIMGLTACVLRDLRQALLAGGPPTLELYGQDKDIFRIEREPVKGESAYGKAWTDEMVGFRTAEDFGCEEWEWLLRSHDWDGLYPLTPGVC